MGGFNKSAPTTKKHLILEPVYRREKAVLSKSALVICSSPVTGCITVGREHIIT